MKIKKQLLLFITFMVAFMLSGCILFPSPYTKTPNVALNKHTCQKKITSIAIFPFDTSGYKGFDAGPNLGENAADQYAVELLRIGYNVIERTRINRVIKEQKIQMTGVIDPNDIVKVGKILGIQGMVVGTIAGKPNAWGLTMRMISVESGMVVWSANSNLRPVKPKVLINALQKELIIRKQSEKCK